ncbi:hypothetical protein SY83_15295 [Paenibacillus swuensis]|uniref:DUF3892 domain-containing protein n=1 Tax=Paenibacillus swuensis TaxID=1178515 RepID=A0A172TPD5_9BACL|nr:DUF3892 domain-containing protein [Paenibacillus swuensis]ANE48949.1 hypothetical protein SY83_15295 [Paenibacillus swuensis]
MNSAEREEVVAVRKNDEGDIIAFKFATGREVDYKEAQLMAKAEQINNVSVIKGKDGDDHLRSNPDGTKANNLDQLPLF